MSRLLGAEGAEFRTDLAVRQDPEAEVLIQGAVPGDLGEGGERDCAPPVLNRPCTHPVEQRAAYTGSLMIRPDAHLLYVRVAIDLVHNHVADGLPGLVDGNPAPSRNRVVSKGIDRRRLVIGNVGQADIPEPLARQAFDHLQGRCVTGQAWTDGGGHPQSMIAVR
jgi:hypothetical protein